MANPKSRNELISAVLDRLGVTAAGQPIEAEDSAKVDDHLDAALEQMAAERIAYVGDPDSIPLPVFGPAAVYVADFVDEVFGKPGAMRAPSPDGSTKFSQAVKSLRIIGAGQSSDAHQVVQYF